jgi:hypothetical protein
MGAPDQPTWAADLMPPDPAADEARGRASRRRCARNVDVAAGGSSPLLAILLHLPGSSRPAAATTPNAELVLGFRVFETAGLE